MSPLETILKKKSAHLTLTYFYHELNLAVYCGNAASPEAFLPAPPHTASKNFEVQTETVSPSC